MHSLLSTVLATGLLLATACGKKAETNSSENRGIPPASPSSTASSSGMAPDELLVRSVLGRDAIAVQTALMRRANPEASLPDGRTPLTHAILTNHTSMIEVLLVGRANANATDSLGNNPMDLALDAGNGYLVRLLVTYGAPLDALDDQGRTPLLRAIDQGDVELATWLVGQGADLTHSDNSGMTALRLAREKNMPQLANIMSVRLQIAAGQSTENLLRGFLQQGNVEGLRNLLETAPDLLLYSREPGALFLAVQGADEARAVAMVRFLISRGLTPQASPRDPYPPLAEAAIRGRLDLMTALIEAGANLEEQDNHQRTALHHAVLALQVPSVRALLARRAQANYRVTENNRTVTRRACDLARSHDNTPEGQARPRDLQEIKRLLRCGYRRLWTF